MLLWSSKGPFEVKVAISAKERYFKFELLHVSNDPQTGELNKDWPGHRVEFNVMTAPQADGWKLNTLLLNYMSELPKGPFKVDDGSNFFWPYAHFSQTTDRPQPQAAVAVYGFVGDEEHDDILTDIWVGEPSLPRPNRANHKSWTRADALAWLNRWVNEMNKPRRVFSSSIQGDPKNLYKLTDLAAKHGVNQIYLHNWEWQGYSVGLPNRDIFPNGVEDVVKWREYCKARGINFHLHGFGGVFMARDKKFGCMVVPDGLARSARGTLVNDFEVGQKEILVKPDYDFYLGMKPGMPPIAQPTWHYTACPPYMPNSALLNINKSLYVFDAKVTPDNLWKIKLNQHRASAAPSSAKAGDVVDFIVTGTYSWFVPDPRSEMFRQVAKDYAELLNHFQADSGYDGSGWSNALGSWQLKKMTQLVYENLDHPAPTGSSSGVPMFGNFEYYFRKARKVFAGGKPGNMTFMPSASAVLASSMDDAHHGLNKCVWSKDMTIRGNHRGITVKDIEQVGVWDEAMKAFKMWSEMKPYMSDEQKSLIDARKKRVKPAYMSDVFVASETPDQWVITRTRAILRPGIDENWRRMAERPDVKPRQYLKADGVALNGLENPYLTQAPVVELHVMAGMSKGDSKNISLMPTRADVIINPVQGSGDKRASRGSVSGPQALGYENGKLIVSYDNSKSDLQYYLWDRGDLLAGHWTYKSLSGGISKLDMNNSRGIAITVNVPAGQSVVGGVLAFATDGGFPRTYVVDIDFEGQRTFEIPHGEACNNSATWLSYLWYPMQPTAVISAHRYNSEYFRAYITALPAGKKTKVEIVNIETMNEDRTTGLINPVLTLNDAKAAVQGTIPYNHYLVYSGGASAKVYSPNWIFVKDLPVTAEGDLKAAKGSNTFSVSSAQSPNIWLSSRIKVKDTENVIKIDKKEYL
ncbi:MAG: hypothetical protein HOD85_24880 [Deltaproteobacteria bacterium]|nr:hypothetical protein [Deltaproteobacteria bacterium]